jgi:hemolysin III
VRNQHLREELANCLTHAFGFLFGLAGLVVLVVSAAMTGDAWTVVTFSVYGASLVLLYLASTLYHTARHPGLKNFLRVIDHSAIFLLIAGTYTPFTLLNMRGPLGWTIFGIIWALAVIGIFFKSVDINRWPVLSVLLYIAMGWLGIVALKPSLEFIPAGGIALLLAGGITYTVGVAFYALEKLPYNHTIWHLFVLGASVFHFFAVLFYAGAMP